MGKVILSPAALKDLEDIHKYISIDSEYYADQVVDKIVQRITILEANPMIGKMVREFKNEFIREIITGNYRTIYEVLIDNRILILRIYHSARILRKL